MTARDPHHDPSAEKPTRERMGETMCYKCGERITAPAYPADSLAKRYDAHWREKHGGVA